VADPTPSRRRPARHRPTAPLAVLVGAAALALILPGCGDDGGPDVASLVQGSGSYQPATEAEAGAGARIVTDVGTQLYGPIAEEAADGNLAFSPLSIATVLAMARTGATGTSADQLDEFFGTSGSAATSDVGRQVDGAARVVQQQTGPVQLAGGEMSSIELTNANAMWGQSDVEWQPAFLDEMKASFDTGMWMADYAEDPEGARRDINDWVAEHTREHITELLPEGSITDLTRLTLTNAVWFKAPWPEELDDAGSQPFTTAAGKQVDASMLTTSGQLAYQQGEGWQAVTLPYAGDDLAMTLLVPDAGELGTVEAALDGELLAQVLLEGEAAAVDLTLPRFDLDQRSAVGEALRGLGVTEPFQTETDFAPMTDDPAAQPLRLDDVLHQATVTVDEHGTEAAAATAAVFTTTSGMVAEHELAIDRPFLFVIHDVAAGTPIFLGRVTDPTAT